MKIAAPHLANLFEFASTLGIEVPGLKKKFLKDPELDLSLIHNHVSEHEMQEVVNELILLKNDNYFGLHYGCYRNLKAMGLIFEISKSATDVEQVILILKDFLESSFPVFELSIVKEQNEVSVILKCHIKDGQVRRHLLDASICIMYRELRLIVDVSCKIEVGFPESELKVHKELLGNEVRMKENYSISFNKESLNKNLHQKSISSLGELLPAYLLLIESSKSTNIKFSDRVQNMMLNMSSPALPEINQVSSQFCMSTRSFQRKLTEEGSSFRSIADRIKHKLSEYSQQWASKEERGCLFAGLFRNKRISACCEKVETKITVEKNSL